jgi:hypothetical protein
VRTITVDKAASVVRNCGLGRQVKVGDAYPCHEGDVVAVRVLNDKATYNQLELVSGRMARLAAGDVVVGALGSRKALLGYEGHVPQRLETGEEINLLNLGGVLGICTSSSPAVGEPYRCEVVGQVLAFPDLASRRGVPANIATRSLPPPGPCEVSPVVAVVGTCMNAGKTEATVAIVRGLLAQGKRVSAGKATGVSLRRDVLAMEDAGAEPALPFTDFGVVSTDPENAPGLAVSLVRSLSASGPDAVLVELGDGLMGEYGVEEILQESEFVGAVAATVVAANDPVGACGAVALLREQYGIEPTVVTGPATDNPVGRRAVTARTGVACANARTDPGALTKAVLFAIKGARRG